MKTIYGENVRLRHGAYYWIRMSWGDEVACYNAGLSKSFLEKHHMKSLIDEHKLDQGNFELTGMVEPIILDNPDFVGIIERVYHPRRKRNA